MKEKTKEQKELSEICEKHRWLVDKKRDRVEFISRVIADIMRSDILKDADFKVNFWHKGDVISDSADIVKGRDIVNAIKGYNNEGYLFNFELVTLS